MLRSFLCIGNGIPCKLSPLSRNLLRFQAFEASISTNTAINKSLRRSQYDGDKVRRRPFHGEEEHGRSILSRPPRGERIRRQNHQQGLDAEDVGQYAMSNQRHRGPIRARTTRRIPGGLKSAAQESTAQGQNWDNRLNTSQYDYARKPGGNRDSRLSTSQYDHARKPGGNRDDRLNTSQYDYARKPGGNRAVRRAARFGHKIETASEGDTTASTRRAARRQAMYRDRESSGFNRPSRATRSASTLDEEEESVRELSMPEDLRDDFEAPLQAPRRSFTMGKQNPQEGGYSSSHLSGDYGRALREEGSASHRLSGGYGREFPKNNDRTARYGEQNTQLSLPYTTPASEFLYGTSVVVAALLSSRRKLYKLYIYDGDNREVRDQDLKVRSLALERNVVVERVKGDWLRVMDRMSTGRPHNGYILEASPLPKLPVVGLQSIERRHGPFHVIMDYQSREDADVNGKETRIKYENSFPRYPLVLLLDGVSDPGNLGAILRTGFFLGVDAVAISNRNSAPVSPVALKASSGASESLPLISVNQSGSFLDTCKKSGWKVYVAAAPSSEKRSRFKKYFSTSDLGSPLQDHPCVLILGSEGEGLQWNIRSKADCEVIIEGQRVSKGKVDSLNVSVAAGLLCDAFLRKPKAADIAVNDSSETTPSVDKENKLF